MYAQMSLETTMTQQLTPQMIQHLSVLQLTTLELQEFIQQKALENPLIDLAESTIEKPYDWLKLASEKNRVNSSSEYEPLFIQRECVKTFLVEQIPLCVTKEERIVLNYLIESLDERLFLTVTSEEVANKYKIAQSKSDELIRLLQSFEPIGVGSKDLIHFLLVHIDLDKEAPPLAKVLICSELKAMAKMDIVNLSKRYNVSVADILETIEYIKKLPRTPAMSFQESAPIIVPDASIQKIDNQWLIELSDRVLPTIKLYDVYVEILKSNEQHYLQKCMREYVTLVQGIDFRKKTLYAIVDYVIVHQPEFLEEGVKALQPMRLKDVAEHLDLHESTISRAIKGKYLHTPFGNVAMQQLFVKSVGNSTTTTICDVIASLIKSEPAQHPYSDQQLVALLKKEGIEISRRTVAKYREQLNIPSSQKRVHLLVAK